MHQAPPGLYQPTIQEVRNAFDKHPSLSAKAGSVFADTNQDFWPGCFIINNTHKFHFRVVPDHMDDQGNLICRLVPRFTIEETFDIPLVIPAPVKN